MSTTDDTKEEISDSGYKMDGRNLRKEGSNLTATMIKNGHYKLFYGNTYVGDIYTDAMQNYLYWPVAASGYLYDKDLREILEGLEAIKALDSKN